VLHGKLAIGVIARIKRVICGMLNPLSLLSRALTLPRCFLRKVKYSCSTNVAVIHS